jgi:bacteriocin biosynthesis cyclodehydratase domain-containing protein
MDGVQMLPCPGVETFLDSHDDLYLLPIAGREQLRISAPLGRWVWALLQDDPPAQIPSELVEQVTEAMDWLAAETYIRPRERVTSAETIVWDRQVRWLAQETGNGPERQRRIHDARVLVLGVGGLGSTVADLLARAGVGTLVLADHDVVDATNLSRQQLYTTADVGRRKVDAARDRLLSVMPECEIVGYPVEMRGSRDVEALLQAHEIDLVVCAADRPPITIKAWVEDAAAVHGAAVIHGGHRPPLVYAGPFFIPGISCCYSCFSRARANPGTEQLERELSAYRDLNPPLLPAVGWGDAAAASMIVAQSIQWIAGVADPAMLGRELEFDLLTLESQWMAGPTEPSCDRCIGAAIRSRVA